MIGVCLVAFKIDFGRRGSDSSCCTFVLEMCAGGCSVLFCIVEVLTILQLYGTAIHLY